VKFNFKFDKYEVEKIIFIPIESSPIHIKEKIDNTITNLVSKTFIDDGRQDDLKKMYDEKRKTMFSGLSKMVGKVVEIEENYDDLYEKYETKFNDKPNWGEFSKEDYDTQKMWGKVVSIPGIDGGYPWTEKYSKQEFIDKLRTDDEFNKNWGG
jgi:hypothetical protein